MIVMFLLQEISRCFSMTGGACLLLKVPDAPQAPMSWRRDVTTRNACCKVHPRRSTVGTPKVRKDWEGNGGNHRQILGFGGWFWCQWGLEHVLNVKWGIPDGPDVISWRCSEFGWDDSSVGKKKKIPWGMIRCCDPGMVKLWHGSLREKVPVYG